MSAHGSHHVIDNLANMLSGICHITYITKLVNATVLPVWAIPQSLNMRWSVELLVLADGLDGAVLVCWAATYQAQDPVVGISLWDLFSISGSGSLLEKKRFKS